MLQEHDIYGEFLNILVISLQLTVTSTKQDLSKAAIAHSLVEQESEKCKTSEISQLSLKIGAQCGLLLTFVVLLVNK